MNKRIEQHKDTLSDNYPNEETETKVKDYETNSLTTDERDEIIRRYNTDYSIRRKTSDDDNDLEQADTRVTDSEDSKDESKDTDSMEQLAHLLGELAEVGKIAVKKNMRFLDRQQLEELLSVGQKLLVGCKNNVVIERTEKGSEKQSISETRGME
ncbi:MAG: hypothetical protein E4H14_00420 [Candidatus Thorarchaeota archaeon]|nr:MAG: hypothetical protein E4H14_00420 [Candidatus Thorarchaeota archaeon]